MSTGRRGLLGIAPSSANISAGGFGRLVWRVVVGAWNRYTAQVKDLKSICSGQCRILDGTQPTADELNDRCALGVSHLRSCAEGPAIPHCPMRQQSRQDLDHGGAICRFLVATDLGHARLHGHVLDLIVFALPPDRPVISQKVELGTIQKFECQRQAFEKTYMSSMLLPAQRL